MGFQKEITVLSSRTKIPENYNNTWVILPLFLTALTGLLKPTDPLRIIKWEASCIVSPIMHYICVLPAGHLNSSEWETSEDREPEGVQTLNTEKYILLDFFISACDRCFCAKCIQSTGTKSATMASLTWVYELQMWKCHRKVSKQPFSGWIHS